MNDQPESGSHARFLPPEPAGPEPDLGSRPEPAYGGYGPPREHDPQGYPAGRGARPADQAQRPADQAHGVPPPWSYPPRASEPDNGSAVAGLVLSVTAASLLLLSAGASTVISIVCAALGIYYSKKGRARVDRGETPKHRGVAQAGFVTGIVTLVLSILATIFWVLIAVLYATDEGFRQDLEDELEGEDSSPEGFETKIRLGVISARILHSMLM